MPETTKPTVLIAGGAGGIGRATALRLADEYKVHSFDIANPEQKDDRIADAIVDCTNPIQINEALEGIEGDIGILIMSLGIMMRGEEGALAADRLELMEKVNRTSRLIVPRMVRSRLAAKAVILDVASRHMMPPLPKTPYDYGRTKLEGAQELLRFATQYGYILKLAILGPYETKIASTDRTEKEIDAAKKYTRPVATAAAKIWELLRTQDHNCQMYYRDDKRADEVLELNDLPELLGVTPGIAEPLRHQGLITDRPPEPMRDDR